MIKYLGDAPLSWDQVGVKLLMIQILNQLKYLLSDSLIMYYPNTPPL